MPRNMTILRAIKNKKQQQLKSSKSKQTEQINQFIPNYKMKDLFNKILRVIQIKNNRIEYLINQPIFSTKDKLKIQSKYLIIKMYYQIMKNKQNNFINQTNQLKNHYRSVLFSYKNEYNHKILQSYEVIKSKNNQRIKQLLLEIKNIDQKMKTKINNIKQNINKKIQTHQLLTLKSSSTFIQNLKLDDQIKHNTGKSQVHFENLTKYSQNHLSIHSKPELNNIKKFALTSSDNRMQSDFKIFTKNRNRNPSDISPRSKFSPNMKKPMVLLKQSNQQSRNVVLSHQYYDIGTPNRSMTPKKKYINTSNKSFSSQRDRLEDRKRIDDLLSIITDSLSPNLEFINMGIKDSYMRQIGQFIVKGKRKVGVLKLVKNLITDKGLQQLLIQLYDYPYMHTLNLTSNYLSNDSLDIILEFSKNNKMLTNFYVSNNNMAVPKGYRMLFNQSGINVFL